MKYKAYRKGLKLTEVPIIFVERKSGQLEIRLARNLGSESGGSKIEVKILTTRNRELTIGNGAYLVVLYTPWMITKTEDALAFLPAIFGSSRFSPYSVAHHSLLRARAGSSSRLLCRRVVDLLQRLYDLSNGS